MQTEAGRGLRGQCSGHRQVSEKRTGCLEASIV